MNDQDKDSALTIHEDDGTLRAYLPDRLWDGMADTCDTGLAPLVKAATIVAVASVAEIPAACAIAPPPGCTIMPGRIDSHGHFTTLEGGAYLALFRFALPGSTLLLVANAGPPGRLHRGGRKVPAALQPAFDGRRRGGFARGVTVRRSVLPRPRSPRLSFNRGPAAKSRGWSRSPF